jgi:thioesterase domain-containing protein
VPILFAFAGGCPSLAGNGRDGSVRWNANGRTSNYDSTLNVKTESQPADVPPDGGKRPDMWSMARTFLTLQRQSVGNSSIVEIQPKGARPPLFLVHGVGGGMLWGYSNLARHLGNDQPIYGFKSRGMDRLEEFTSIEEMAAHYVADLRKFQPQGPYHLGGYCFGGNVAYEMARQLTAQNQEVGLLLLMNCWPNNSSYMRLSWTPAFLAKFLWNLGLRLLHQIRCGMRQPSDYFKWRTGWVKKRVAGLFSRREAGKVMVDDIVDLSRQPEHERKLWRTHVQAWLQYQPQPYPGHIVVFRTRGHPLVCSFDHKMGWGSFAGGGVTVRLCRGDHESILEEENAGYTARCLQAVLDEMHQQKNGVEVVESKKNWELLQVATKAGYAAGTCKIGVAPNSRTEL